MDGNLNVDDAAVSGQPETASRLPRPLAGILTGVLRAAVQGENVPDTLNSPG